MKKKEMREREEYVKLSEFYTKKGNDIRRSTRQNKCKQLHKFGNGINESEKGIYKTEIGRDLT